MPSARDGGEPLRFAVLGPLVVTPEPESPPLRPAHRRLLAVLVLAEGRPVGTDWVIDRLWPRSPPATARAALHTHLSGLRKRLGAEVVKTRGSGYELDLSRHWLDRTEFDAHAAAAATAFRGGGWGAAAERAEAALELWRGRPFDEVADDEFAQPEVSRLQELRLQLIEIRCASVLEQGWPESVLPDLERLSAEHPLRERLWELLMIGRARVGRTADALRAYHDVRAILDEMGLEPSSALRKLETRILRQDPRVVPAAVRHNVPLAASTLIGREAEREQLLRLVRAHRGVTVTGAGGAGKTRLAQEVARELVGDLREGAWFVDLASVTEPRLVAAGVAAALGVRTNRGSAVHALREALRQRSILCVLDNCEHVLDGAGEVVAALLDAGPGVRVLSTSREPLGVPGEAVYRLPPLAVPDQRVLAAEQLMDYDAVKLLIDRARLTGRPFRLDADNAAAVAEICRRLDGLPLAIELAAARLGSLSPRRMVDRLRFGAGTLSGRRPGGPPRHRAIETTIAWSHDLLPRPERVLLARLAVFAGSFSLDAVEQVCGAPPVDRAEVVDLLAHLVDKSLVERIADADEDRFRLLETIRQFAAAQLSAADTADLRFRHRDWYMDFARKVEERLQDVDGHERLASLDAEHDNLDAALRYAIDSDAPATTSVLASAVAAYWYTGGQYGQTVETLQVALHHSERGDGRDEVRDAELRRRLAAALFNVGDEDGAWVQAQRAVELVRGTPPSPVRTRVLTSGARFSLLHADRDPALAVPLAQEAVDTAVAIGRPLLLIRALVVLGSALGWNGRVSDGLQRLRSARDMAQRVGDAGTTLVVDLHLVMLLYLDGQSRRSEPRRLVGEVVTLLERGLDNLVDDWVPWDWAVYVFLHSGEWDRAQELIDEMERRHLEGWDRTSLLMVRATLRWMQGRLPEADADVLELRRHGVPPRWYHDFYPLAAEVAAAQGRLADVRALAAEHLAMPVDPSEESMKLGTLRALVAAEADRALAVAGDRRCDHSERAREGLETMAALLRRFPPATDGSLQIETASTYLALAEAEVARTVAPDPSLWRSVERRSTYAYWRIYAGRRHAEALAAVGLRDESVTRLRVARRQARLVGALGLL